MYIIKSRDMFCSKEIFAVVLYAQLRTPFLLCAAGYPSQDCLLVTPGQTAKLEVTAHTLSRIILNLIMHVIYSSLHVVQILMETKVLHA